LSAAAKSFAFIVKKTRSISRGRAFIPWQASTMVVSAVLVVKTTVSFFRTIIIAPNLPVLPHCPRH
jgi:hypothetical protein